MCHLDGGGKSILKRITHFLPSEVWDVRGEGVRCPRRIDPRGSLACEPSAETADAIWSAVRLRKGPNGE